MNTLLPNTLQTMMSVTELKRILRAVQSAIHHKNSSVIMVTSALQNEGKTTLVAGLLAAAARETDKNVLGIDLNWYTPALHTAFGLDLLAKESYFNGSSLGNLIQKSGITNLDILSGVKICNDDNEIFSKTLNKIALLVNEAKKNYSMIIIDTSKNFPPNRFMIDPIDISNYVDGVVMVVMANKTPRQEVKRTKIALETAGASLLGCVVNQVNNPAVYH